jgi:hypothetical protein
MNVPLNFAANCLDSMRNKVGSSRLSMFVFLILDLWAISQYGRIFLRLNQSYEVLNSGWLLR